MASKVEVNSLPIDLQWIKEDLIKTDLINQLDIAYGLKQLLINNTFTLKSLLNTPASELAKILGIDDYVASLINNAVMRLVDQHTNVLLAYNR
ncbi:MAG TPA: hypothetical protein VEL11_14900 [Candidatus Bathyarchaeia archaeon]|nr:hypothetical protein [Candidatus Bathyarchaeia archaeon]